IYLRDAQVPATDLCGTHRGSAVEYLRSDDNFLKIEDEAHYRYADCLFVIHSAPYEHTSSYRAGSKEGPRAIIQASHFVELYDEELDTESYRHGGICTLP